MTSTTTSPKQRRGKTTPASGSTTTTAEGSQPAAPAVSLDRAFHAVQSNQRTALNLHHQWRTQLLRLSFIVMVVTFHQFQLPSSACIKQIKKFNLDHTKDTTPLAVSGWEAIQMVFYDGIVELLGILCSACWVWCLSRSPTPLTDDSSSNNKTHDDFESIPYKLASLTTFVMMSLYFHFTTRATETTTEMIGCLPRDRVMGLDENHNYEEIEERKQAFPVVLMYHVIASLSLFFMQYQCRQHDRNIQMVEKLQADLQKSGATSTSSSNSAGDKKTSTNPKKKKKN